MSRVREIGSLFLRLGVTAFGGPAAHIAMMRTEVVRRRQWVDDAEFLALVGATNLIPGPNSTELAIHLGARRAGWRGLLTAGVCFIGPAVVIVGLLAWLYARYGTTAAAVDVRYGVLPVIVAIVAHAVTGLARTALTAWTPRLIALGALAAYLLDVHELLVLFAGGALALAGAYGPRAARRMAALAAVPLIEAAGAAPRPVSLPRLFFAFLEIGSVLYGSGYVLVAFMQRVLVDDFGWLTTEQVLDAVAVGQVTPGPVFTSATFVGWQVDGPAGAAVATAGIFLPAFVFVALLHPLMTWVRRHPPAEVFLAGVTAASLGLMAGVLVDLADAALTDALRIALAVAALAVLLRAPQVNPSWVVLGGLAIGFGHLLVR